MQGSNPGRPFQSPTPKPLVHQGTWMTQSLTLGSLYHFPLFEIRAPGSGHFQPRQGTPTRVNPGYCCHHWNLSHPFQSPTPKPLRQNGTWMTQSLTLPSLYHFSLFEIRAPGSGHFQPRQGASTHVNPGYFCHHWNLCHPFQSPTLKPLSHNVIWMTQSLILGLLQ